MTMKLDLEDDAIEKIAVRVAALISQPKLTMTSDEVAEELHCSVEYVNELRRSHKLRGVKKGKIYIYSRKAVEDYISYAEKKCR